jgi:hypothetical protein
MGVTFSPSKEIMEIISFKVLTDVGTRVTTTVGFYETLVPTYQNTRCHILGYSDLDGLTSRLKYRGKYLDLR